MLGNTRRKSLSCGKRKREKRAPFSSFSDMMAVVICNVAITISPGTNLFDTPRQHYTPGTVLSFSRRCFFQARIFARVANQPSHCALYDACRSKYILYCYGYSLVLFHRFSTKCHTGLRRDLRRKQKLLSHLSESARAGGGIGTWEKLPGRLREIVLFQRKDTPNAMASQVHLTCRTYGDNVRRDRENPIHDPTIFSLGQIIHLSCRAVSGNKYAPSLFAALRSRPMAHETFTDRAVPRPDDS